MRDLELEQRYKITVQRIKWDLTEFRELVERCRLKSVTDLHYYQNLIREIEQTLDELGEDYTKHQRARK